MSTFQNSSNWRPGRILGVPQCSRAWSEINLDVSTLIFAVAIAFLAAITSGLGPALQITADERGPFSTNGLVGELAGKHRSASAFGMRSLSGRLWPQQRCS